MVKKANSGPKRPIGIASFVALAGIFVFCISVSAQRSMTKLKIPFLPRDFAVNSLNDKAWDGAVSVPVDKYWSGKKAPVGRHFEARLMWSNDAFYVRFEGVQAEELVVSKTPELRTKTLGLWDRDVCEIFIAPNPLDRNKYFEFEVAPSGEWVDIAINWSPKKRRADPEYSSGLESAAFVEPGKIMMAIKIPWKAFGKTPKVGDIWLGNLFRCIGKVPERGYLAWQATKTAKPNFHVPSKFGEFEFVTGG